MAVVDSLEFSKHISKIKNILMYRNVGMMVTPHLLPISNKYWLSLICFESSFLPSKHPKGGILNHLLPPDPPPVPPWLPKVNFLQELSSEAGANPPCLCCTSDPPIRPAWVCSPLWSPLHRHLHLVDLCQLRDGGAMWTRRIGSLSPHSCHSEEGSWRAVWSPLNRHIWWHSKGSSDLVSVVQITDS